MEDVEGRHASERASPGERMAGSAHALLGALRSPSEAEAEADPTARGVQVLLSHLEASHRFELAGVVARFESAGVGRAQGAAVLLRCLPIAWWLRGPRERIALATVRLAESLGAGAQTGIGAAFVNQWVRNLFAHRRPRRAWEQTHEDMKVITGFLGTEASLWATFSSAVHSPGLSTMHPVTLAIRRTNDAVEAAQSLEDMMRVLADTGADGDTLALGASLGGMRFGVGPAEATWPVTTLADSEKSMVRTVGERAARLYRLDRWPPETSDTHPLLIATVMHASGGRLGISPAPGRQGFDAPHAPIERDLGQDVSRIAAWGADHVVCLLGPDVLIDAGMDGLGPELESRGIRFWHIPPPEDPAAPWFVEECGRLVSRLADALVRGRSVLVHDLDLERPATTFAARVLSAASQGEPEQDARQKVEIAVETARIDFSRHDQDE